MLDIVYKINNVHPNTTPDTTPGALWCFAATISVAEYSENESQSGIRKAEGVRYLL